MSKIIEIIGPPGVGKTSIHNSIINSWNKNNTWIPAYRLFPVASDAKYRLLNNVMLFARKLLGRGLVDHKEVIKASYRFLATYPEFIEFCWELIHFNRQSDHHGVDNRFRSAFYLFKIFGEYQIVSESNESKVALTDELLTHRIIQITNDEINNDQITNYVKLLPKPKGVIFLHAPAEVITHRILSRDREIIRHKKLNKNELLELTKKDILRFQLIADQLMDNGVDVLKVDTSESKESNLENINTYLSKI